MDKKITAQDAAKAVLKKAEEMLKSSKMAKCGALSTEKAPMAKDETGGESPMEMSEKNVTPVDGVVAEPQAAAPHGTQNTDGEGNGVHKLAKFMGRREEKAKHKAAPAPQAHDASQQTPPTAAPMAKSVEDAVPGNRMKRAQDYAARGDHKSEQIAKEGAKEAHKEKLAGIKAQPKVNLPKGGK